MTIKEIANLAGVSISTVSKIVNNKDLNINPETRSRVLKIVKEYNYTPYGKAKNASTAKSFLIGVLLKNGSPSDLMLNGILHAAHKYGYSILIYGSENCKELELKHITSLCRNKIDGIIWEPVSDESTRHEHYFTEQNISVCYINESSKKSFHIDFSHLGYRLTQKLIDYKHTKIACLLKENSLRSSLVLDGFKKCLYDNQISYNDNIELYISDKDYLSKVINNNISGIVCSHFTSSLILYEQMERLHYCIPSDLSLVSLGNDVRERFSIPHISTLPIPYFEFGCHICETLIKKCEKKEDTFIYSFASSSTFENEYSIESPSFLRVKKLLVVGSIHLDVTFNVDHLPQAGKTTTILNTTTTAGGKGANQSIGAAKLLREVSLIGEIGNDTEATFLFDTLERENVSTQGVHRTPNSQTGKAFIYTENSGESAITILSGANRNLSAQKIRSRKSLFKNASYCLLATEIPIDTVIETAKVAKEYGVKIILKPATLKTVPNQLLALTDILIPNDKEATALCPHGNSVEERAEYFLEKGIETVIITLGEKGCFLKTADVSRYFPAADFLTIDTTGGADAFISAFATYLSEGFLLEQSIRIATYAAGFCVSRQGVVPALVDRNTLETHIRKLEPELLERTNIP